ncbi:MAG: DNA-binding protein [Betaproteobacteria bacterium]|jgi:gp16 family phage-associated protein|nr:DNA-binding protein [Rubrivivax sp.]
MPRPRIKAPDIKTPDAVRAELQEAGLSLAEWARAHNVSYEVTKAVLAGRLKGKRGEAHRIAIGLGLKVGKVIAPQAYGAPPPKPHRSLRVVP